MKTKITLILFSVFLILAMYGVQPLSTYTDNFISWTKNTSVFAKGSQSLTLAKMWIGEGPQELSFNSKAPPYILTVKAEVKTSTLAPTFDPLVYHEDSATEFGILGLPPTMYEGAFVYNVLQEGKYTIRVKAFGYRWYAKVVQ